MIDDLGLILDQTGDAADSCNFTCCAILIGLYDDKETVKNNAVEYFWNGGMPVRHPKQSPANNPLSFTRDQAVPLMWCLDDQRIKTFLHRNRFFFSNEERDLPGSKKRPWPHKFWKDSRPTTENFPPWVERDQMTVADTTWSLDFKVFDGPDLMTPDFIGMCHALMGIKSGFMYQLGKMWCEQSIVSHCKQAKDKSFSDFKQLYFTAKAYGLHQEFAQMHPWGLYFAAEEYFTNRRGMPEMTQGFFKEFKREGIRE